MADETNKADTSGLETSVATEKDTYTAEFGSEGTKVQRGGLTADTQLGEEAKTTTTEPEGVTPKPGEEEGAGEGEEAKVEGAAGEEAALPAFDPDNEEASAAWDNKYFPGDGTKLNMEAFGAELTGNMNKEGGKAELNPDSYKFLESRLGVTKEDVDRIIAGQVASAQLQDQALFDVTGGREGYVSMLEFAKDAYTEPQKEIYRAAMKVGGQQAMDQIDLLKARFQGAGNKLPSGATSATASQRRTPPQRRPSSPAKSATDASTATGAPAAGTVFATASEHQAALRAAGRDAGKLRAVAEKLRRSTYWQPSKK